MLVPNFWRFLLVKPQGAWKNRRLKTETDTETDGGNGNTYALDHITN